MLAEALRWAAVAVFAATVIRFPRPSGFWSHGASRPLVLARAAVAHDRFRSATH